MVLIWPFYVPSRAADWWRGDALTTTDRAAAPSILDQDRLRAWFERSPPAREDGPERGHGRSRREERRERSWLRRANTGRRQLADAVAATAAAAAPAAAHAHGSAT
ncbi:MAG: hypothetical protein K0S78_4002, partial [Thermomicrobiales bacterium]|nr:hypothetical protein [Thermomicrobiales bacterium]